MAINYEQWGQLALELMPYVEQCANGEISKEEFFEICDKKAEEFSNKRVILSHN